MVRVSDSDQRVRPLPVVPTEESLRNTPFGDQIVDVSSGRDNTRSLFEERHDFRLTLISDRTHSEYRLSLSIQTIGGTPKEVDLTSKPLRAQNNSQ